MHDIKRKADLGDQDAQRIYPIRKDGTLLLTTLLLGNVMVNTVLAVILGDITGSIIASVIATALIFVFGEIIPQAVFSRNALQFGAKMIPFVYVIRFILYPIVWPIAKILDFFLKEEVPTLYSHNELIKIVAEHGDHPESAIDIDEERILHGALQFSHRTASEIMTHATRVFSLEVNSIINQELCEQIKDQAFSRIPLYYKEKNRIVGLVHVRDLVGVNSGNLEDYKQDCLSVASSIRLDTLMNSMLRRHQHFAVVLDTIGDFVGIVTLEDILEEVIGREILDEEDELI
jgi:metal transporter CNNM